MRIGSLVYATEQGLGVLARSFYRAGVLSEVLVVEHQHWPNHFEWYPKAERTPIHPVDQRAVNRILSRVDAMLFFETPFNWDLIRQCHVAGVKSILMPMYECMPKTLPHKPDKIINPSLLDQQYYPEGVFLPVPVEYTWRQRTKAEVFVHNAGHGGLKSRNGTGVLLDAMRYVKSPLKLILRSQKSLQWDARDPRIEVRVGNFPFDSLYSEGDVFVFPEKFNGLSLPLQEARAAGMLVMCGDRFPMNTWLPTEPLVPVHHYERNCVSGRCLEFDEAIIEPEAVAKKMDEWYGRDITEYSLSGNVWAESMSWENLKPRYLKEIAS